MFFFLPYRVERPLKALPWATMTIIALNVVAYGLSLINQTAVWDALGFRPDAHGIYTWFTAMFLHGDFFLHLGGNMFFLWLFGAPVEDSIGRVRYIALYVLGGLAAAMLHGAMMIAFVPGGSTVPMIGASGALAAIMGIFAVRLYKTQVRFAYVIFIFVFLKWGSVALASVWAIGLWALRELASGVFVIGGASSGVANWAHIGGLLLGVGGAFALGLKREGVVGYLTEEAQSCAAVGMHDLAAGKMRDAQAMGGSSGVDFLVTQARSSSFAPNPGAGPSEGETRFREAFDALMQQGRRGEALGLYAELAWKLHDEQASARTILNAATLAEGMRDFQLAVQGYSYLVRAFPASFEGEKAAFRLPHALLASDEDAEAQKAWREFADAYPNSQWMPYADSRLLAAM